MARHYPLESLGAVRRLSKERRARDLNCQTQRTENAETALASARAAHQRHIEAAGAIELDERKRLVEGKARAGDLAATGAWRSAADRQAASLARQVRKTERQCSEERSAQGAARKLLAAAEADVKAADEHRARWQSREAACAQTRADDDAADVWLSRERHPSSRKRDRGP
ncbi:MAG: hypothetical protein JW940_30010 [Polyangiaceae bacterium]|nr:hypothetical protein [Polyangiaceae bacterium]